MSPDRAYRLWKKVYMGYGDMTKDPVLELTYNRENNGYKHGTAYGNISLAVRDGRRCSAGAAKRRR